MASIRERTLKGKKYYYLVHSYRVDGKVEKRERYLGTTVPEDIERHKAEFMDEVKRERWFVDLDRIKAGYSAHRESMPETARDKEVEAFATMFTYNTNRIEGSRLTLMETAELLERGITPGGRPINDVKEAEAHRDALYKMLEYGKDLSMQTVLYFHKMIFEATKGDISGKLREHPVIISGSKFTPPLPVEVHLLLVELFKWYRKAKQKVHPVELAALVHLRLVTIHPFTDGNGRVSRLMMNMVLAKAGYPMLDIPYEKRSGYYRALERAQTREEDTIFLHWFFRRYMAQNKRYI
jgi:Fic family protein